MLGTPGIRPLRILYYNRSVSHAEVVAMQAQSESKLELNPEQAAEHLSGVHHLLKVLQDKIGEH